VLVTDGPAAVFSVNEQPPGSIVDPAGAALRVSVEALAPEGGTLRVYLGRQLVRSFALSRGERASERWEITGPAEDSYVRIDIERPQRRAGEPPVSLLSNPVLIDVGPQRSSWR
jgi:hypothetical protein